MRKGCPGDAMVSTRCWYRVLALTCPVVVVMTTAAVAQEVLQPPGFEIERVSWVGEVAAGRGITVRNQFGDVRARFGGYDGKVEILASLQHFADEGARLQVETDEAATGLTVTVGYRTDDGELATARDPGQRKRGDLVVFVPRDATLVVSTDHGLVDLRGLRSNVHATTVSGDIRTRKIEGELDLDTGSGDVVALLEAWHTARTHALVSGSGDLSVVFGGEVNAVIRVATSGLISTDFSLRVEHRSGQRPVRRGDTLVGKGSSTVTVRSDAGHVRLVRKPLADDARVLPETEPFPR